MYKKSIVQEVQLYARYQKSFISIDPLLAVCSVVRHRCFYQSSPAWLPITLQTFFSTLAGLLLGKKWGTVSVVVYLLLGLIASHSLRRAAASAMVTKPTFGFLLGLAPATFCTGLLFERSRKSWSSAFLASLAGAVILYVVGLPYFYGIMTLYLQQAMTVSQLFAVYCLPTLPGDVIKCIVCASVVGRLRTALSQKLPV